MKVCMDNVFKFFIFIFEIDMFINLRHGIKYRTNFYLIIVLKWAK